MQTTMKLWARAFQRHSPEREITITSCSFDESYVSILIEGDLDKDATDFLEELVPVWDVYVRLNAMLAEMDTWT